LFVGNTVFYLLLRYYWLGRSGVLSFSSLLVFVVFGALQYYSYVGILDAHAVAATTATNASAAKQTSSSSSSSSRNSNALIGGHALDIFGLTVVVQYGSLLVSTKFYYLLAILPLWGAWTLYNMVRGNRNSGTTSDHSQRLKEEKEETDPTAERRKQRAEKRRQKWT